MAETRRSLAGVFRRSDRGPGREGAGMAALSHHPPLRRIEWLPAPADLSAFRGESEVDDLGRLRWLRLGIRLAGQVGQGNTAEAEAARGPVDAQASRACCGS